MVLCSLAWANFIISQTWVVNAQYTFCDVTKQELFPIDLWIINQSIFNHLCPFVFLFLVVTYKYEFKIEIFYTSVMFLILTCYLWFW